MIPARPSRSQGFTLVELMMVVSILGALATVAITEFTRVQLRSKSAERATIMEAVANAVNDVVMMRDGVADRVPGFAFVGGPNPIGAPTTTKRPWAWGQPGWTMLPMIVKGNAYYSYSFVALDPVPRGTSVTLVVVAEGDLDGDTQISRKDLHYVANGYVFMPDPVTPEVPQHGFEDATTF